MQNGDTINELNNSFIDISKRFLESKKGKIAIALVIILTIIVAVLAINANKLSYEEKHAIRNVKDYQSMLKDPDSLILRGDVVVLYYYDDKSEEDKIKHYTFFNTSANNSFGASIQSLPCYEGYIYLANLLNYNQDDFDTTDEYLDVLKADYAYQRYNLMGIDEEIVFKAEKVDGKKIARKLHIKHKDN